MDSFSKASCFKGCVPRQPGGWFNAISSLLLSYGCLRQISVSFLCY